MSKKFSVHTAWVVILSMLLSISPFLTQVYAAAPIVWVQDSATKIYKSSPVPSSLKSSINLYMAKNEFEAAQICLRSATELSNVSITVNSLIGPGGATIPASNITARRVQNIAVQDYHPYYEYDLELPPDGSKIYPDILVDNSPVALPTNTTLAYWYSVYTPATQAAGTYTGTAVVNTSEGNVTVNVSVIVYSVTIPSIDSSIYKVCNWFGSVGWDSAVETSVPYQYNVSKFDSNWWTVMSNIAKNFKKHRTNFIYLDSVALLAPDTTIDDNGNYSFDWTKFDQFVQTFIDNGVGQYIWDAQYLGSGKFDGGPKLKMLKKVDGMVQVVKVDTDTTESNNWCATFLTALKNHLDAKGWTGKYYICGIDEPDSPSQVAQTNWLYSKIDTYAPGIRKAQDFYKYLPGFEASATAFIPEIDGLEFQKAYYEERRATAGKELWTYVCIGPEGNYLNRFIDISLLKPRLIHWFNFRNNVSGYMHFGYNLWRQTPDVMNYYETNNPGDGYIVYPNKAAYDIYDSIRFEADLDGIEDYELLNILRTSKPQSAAAIVDNVILKATDYTKSGEAVTNAHRAILDAIAAENESAVMTTFSDNFSSGNDNSWYHEVGNWSVSGGEYIQSLMPGWGAYSNVRGSQYSNFTFSFDTKITNNGGDNWNWVGCSIRSRSVDDTDTGYLIGLRNNNQLFITRAGITVATSNVSGISLDQYTNIKVETNGTNIKVYVAGRTTPELDINDTLYSYGYLGLRTGGCSAKFDNVAVVLPGVSFSDNFGAFSNTMLSMTKNFGTWAVEAGEFSESSGNGMATLSGKTFYDAGTTISADVKIVNDNGNNSNWAGIVFNKANPNDYYTQSGIMVYIRNNGQLCLYRAGSGVLQTYNTGVIPSGFVNIKVVTNGAGNIKVYFNNSDNPVMEIDDWSQLYGYVSLYTGGTHAHYDNFSVSGTLDYYDNYGVNDINNDIMWTNNNGGWAVESGEYSENTGNGMATITGKTYSNATIWADLKVVNDNGNNTNWAALLFRKTNATDNYLQSGYMVYYRNNGQICLYKAGAGNLQTYSTGIIPSSFVNVKVVMNGSNIKVYVNGSSSAVIDVTDTTYTSGYVGLCTGGAHDHFDNVKITTP